MRHTLRSLLRRWTRRSALPIVKIPSVSGPEVSIASRPRLLMLEDKSLPSGTATGFVFNDTNFNGVFEPAGKGGADVGLESVTVTAYDKFNKAQGTTTTAADGSYSLPLGGTGPYRLEFTNLPTGFVYGIRGADSGSPVQFVPEGGASNISLALNDTTKTTNATPFEIGDRIWIDIDNDGVQDASEPGLGGIQVQLVDIWGNVFGTATTDANGFYTFTNAGGAGSASFVTNMPLVQGGLFELRVLLNQANLAGYVASPPKVNSGPNSNLRDSDGVANIGNTYVFTPFVVAVNGESHPNLDFGFAGAGSLGSIGDFVWFDQNQNGIQDPGEIGLPNVTINLYDGNNNFITSTTPNNFGFYSFTGLAPGQYIVEFVPNSPFFVITQSGQGGDPKLDSDADPITGRTATITLGPGETNTDIDCGLIKPFTALIGDFVWIDMNCNGIQDMGEPGLAGVTVTLLDGQNNFIASTVTDADGKYVFTNLAPGDYRVQFTAPAGYTFSPQNQGSDPTRDSDADPLTGLTAVIAIAAGGGTADIDAGMCPPMLLGSIGDYVWFDMNQNGIQDPGEPGVGNQTVNLYDGTGKFLATQLTDLNGFYLFTDLQPGDYIIEVVTQPAGWFFTKQGQGGDPKLDSDVDPLTGRTGIITLAAGENNLDVDAGLIKSLTIVIGDFVWLDLNCDGIQDPNEPGFAGVKVNLLDVNNMVVASQFTDVNGKYLFTGITPGTYSVEFILPMGFTFSPMNTGTPGNDSDVDPNTGRTPQVTLMAGDSNLDLDAGLCQVMPMKISLGDYVWLDIDCDGLQDPNEPGVQGITVNLLDSQGKIIGTTTTNINGKYLFSNLDPGTYQVQFVPLPGYAFTKANVGNDPAINSHANVLTGLTPQMFFGMDDFNQDAGLVVLKEISGFVYEDANDNGVFDPGENPISGVTITLTGTDDLGNPVIIVGTTDASGKYSFINIRPGVYNITETQPKGYLDGKDTLGTPFPGIVGQDQFLSVMIDCDPATAVGTDYNFGELKPSSVRGKVYWDKNNNGVPDAGEPGIPSTTVILTGIDNRGNLVSRTILTGPDGTYLFTGLRPGTYTITEVQPPGWLDGKDRVGSEGGVLGNDVISQIPIGYAVNAFNYDFGEILGGQNNPGKEDLLASSTSGSVPSFQSAAARTSTTPTFANAVASTMLADPAQFRFVVAGPDAGSAPIVRVFDYGSGVLRYQIMAYDPSFRGGVRVATGDVTGDGVPDIITAAGTGGGPHIRVFDGSTGGLVAEFFAYSAGFTGGVYVATGDVNGDGIDEIITGAGEGGGPHVRVFTAGGILIQEWFAYAASFTGGVRVAAGDVNGDGREDVITAAGPGGGPHVRVFNVLPLSVLGEFFAYAASFVGGVYVAAGDTNNDGLADIITGAGAGGGPHVRVFGGPSTGFVEYYGFFAYPANYTGGVRVGAQDINADCFVDVLTTPGSGISTFTAVYDVTRASAMDMFLAFDPTNLGGAFISG